ncbi:heterokaryon incompatibility protein-domain-containing protein, partial [Bisporella sp. PMI_857]
ELPLPSEEVIECDLVAVNRADNPMYEALSYEWGPKNQDGAVFPVRVNGHLLNPRPLWADAVCINQEDLIEKSDQVQNMGDLFGHAWNTIIWLGKEHE